MSLSEGNKGKAFPHVDFAGVPDEDLMSVPPHTILFLCLSCLQPAPLTSLLAIDMTATAALGKHSPMLPIGLCGSSSNDVPLLAVAHPAASLWLFEEEKGKTLHSAAHVHVTFSLRRIGVHHLPRNTVQYQCCDVDHQPITSATNSTAAKIRLETCST